MFQYFSVQMTSYALQTAQDSSQQCIFQDFVQSGVKCLHNVVFPFLSGNTAY